MAPIALLQELQRLQPARHYLREPFHAFIPLRRWAEFARIARRIVISAPRISACSSMSVRLLQSAAGSLLRIGCVCRETPHAASSLRQYCMDALQVSATSCRRNGAAAAHQEARRRARALPRADHCKCGAQRIAEPQALARLCGASATLEAVGRRMRCSKRGKNNAEVVAIAIPRLRGQRPRK